MGRIHAGGSEIFIDEFDYSGVINAITIDQDRPIADVTSFTDTDATYIPG